MKETLNYFESLNSMSYHELPYLLDLVRIRILCNNEVHCRKKLGEEVFVSRVKHMASLVLGTREDVSQWWTRSHKAIRA